jgi:hypothetical protein
VSRAEYLRAWKKANPEKVRAQRERSKAKRDEWLKANPEKSREYQLHARYGLSLRGYEYLMKKQKGVCAICKKPSKSNLHVDHEHVKGYKDLPPNKKRQLVRGLLCHWCNRYLLGNRKQEDLELIFRNAKKYIEAYARSKKEME